VSTKKIKLTIVIILAVGSWGFTIIGIFNIDVCSSSKKSSGQAYSNEQIDWQKENLLSKLPKDLGYYNYNPSGVPDPFGGYESLGLQKDKYLANTIAPVEPTGSSLKLAGIIWDEVEPFAVVLSADGKSHNVKINDVVNNEKIVDIQEDLIIVEKKFLKKILKFELKQGSQKKL